MFVFAINAARLQSWEDIKQQSNKCSIEHFLSKCSKKLWLYLTLMKGEERPVWITLLALFLCMNVDWNLNHLLWHWKPSPRKPSLHWHWNEPGVFVQVALEAQTPCAHSSMSTMKMNFDTKIYVRNWEITSKCIYIIKYHKTLFIKTFIFGRVLIKNNNQHGFLVQS